jgi:hypothetical protein
MTAQPAMIECTRDGFTISTDKSRLDVTAIHEFLCNSSLGAQCSPIDRSEIHRKFAVLRCLRWGQASRACPGYHRLCRLRLPGRRIHPGGIPRAGIGQVVDGVHCQLPGVTGLTPLDVGHERRAWTLRAVWIQPVKQAGAFYGSSSAGDARGSIEEME